MYFGRCHSAGLEFDLESDGGPFTKAERRGVEEPRRRARDDLDALFARLQAAHDVEVVQEPIDQDYGIRDAAVRDPAGNMIRIQQRTKA